jgi:hypothetical protein
MEDGVPGAAKNTGGGALAFLSLPCKGTVASEASRVGFDRDEKSPTRPLAKLAATLQPKSDLSDFGQ